MVPIPPQIQAVEKHIPAWKKLGLKLKYAKEEHSPSEIPNGTPSTITNEKKRKLSLEIPTDTPVAKKPKKSKPKSKTSEKDATTNPASSPQPLKSSTSSPIESRESKRRSVSFTPATKVHDGEGVKEYIKRWSASHPERAENLKAREAGYFQSESGAEAEHEEGSAVETKKKKKKKKKKKSKSTMLPLKPASGLKTPKLPASGSTGTQSAPSKALQYLEHHQTSPSTWKFSKSRQNSLFRSLFSLIEIPSSYDSALLAYLRGLSRTAAATIRVRNMALDVRKGDEEWTKKEEGQQDWYARVVEKMKAGLRKGNLEDLDLRAEGPEENEVKRKEWEEKLKKRRRAEVILFAVGDQADPPPPPVPISASIAGIKPTKTYLNSTSPGPSTTTTTNNNNNSNIPHPHPTAATTTTPFVKPKRKRKTRTLAFSSSSSSSSSESSSSSSSREKKATKPAVARKKLVWDTTTSSDDDDSSSSASE